MNSDIDDFLDSVDRWKSKLHEKLKRMTRSQRQAFWAQVHGEARKVGLPAVDARKVVKRAAGKVRRTA